MRFYIVLATLSLFIWAAAAGVSGVSHPTVKAVGDSPTDDAAAPVAEAAGPAIPTPAGPPTAAEQKLDETLKCVEACASSNVVCTNSCIYTSYNVPASAGVPSVSAVVPGPIATTASGAPAAATTAHTTTTGSGANTLHAGVFAVGIATLVASFVSFMV